MHSLKIAALATVAVAASVSAQDCNPSYNTTSAGECFDQCNMKAGKELYADWTNDPKSPNFLKSLSLMCNKGTSEYMAFMTKGGMCMVSCADPEKFSAEFSSACGWWQEHKGDECTEGTSPASSGANSSAPSSSSAPSASGAPSSSQSAQPTSEGGNSSGNKLSGFAVNIQTCTIAFTGIAAYFLI